MKKKIDEFSIYLAVLGPIIASSLVLLSTQDTDKQSFVVWLFLVSKYLLYNSHFIMYTVSTFYRFYIIYVHCPALKLIIYITSTFQIHSCQIC